MFQVKTPVVIVPSAEARAALGVQLRPAALAAWQDIARRGKGIEFAHFQLVYAGVTLAVCSHLRRDGFIEIGLGLGDPGMAGRVVTEAEYRAAARPDRRSRGMSI